MVGLGSLSVTTLFTFLNTQENDTYGNKVMENMVAEESGNKSHSSGSGRSHASGANNTSLGKRENAQKK